MKKMLIALSIIILAMSAHAESTEQLSSLADVISALNRGATVSVTVDLTRCAPAGDTTMQGSTRGGLKINTYQVLSDGSYTLATSARRSAPMVTSASNPHSGTQTGYLFAIT